MYRLVRPNLDPDIKRSLVEGSNLIVHIVIEVWYATLDTFEVTFASLSNLLSQFESKGLS